MSKRGAEGQGGADRYGGTDQPDGPMDPPRKATAAQLAKRNIKPLKGRPGAGSRLGSPSKASPSPTFNPFDSNGGSNNSGNSSSSNTFGQSGGPQPPSSSFSFGGGPSAAPSNPFGSLSSSQSFPPANNNSNSNNGTSNAFSFGQSQPAAAPAAAPSFAPPSTSSFSFGASSPSGGSFTFGASPAKAQENGDKAAQTPSFTFGSNTQSPQPSAPSTPAAASSFGNPFSGISTNAFGQSQEQAITDAEVHEIESAGPRLMQESKLDDLANIVRNSDPKYKDTDLAGLNLKTLAPAVQRKMLDYVRGKSKEAAKYADVPPFTHAFFLNQDGRIDWARLHTVANDVRMPDEWIFGANLMLSQTEDENLAICESPPRQFLDSGGYQYQYQYPTPSRQPACLPIQPSGPHGQATVPDPRLLAVAPVLFQQSFPTAAADNAQPFNAVENSQAFVPTQNQDTMTADQLAGHGALSNSTQNIDPQLLLQQPSANNLYYQTPQTEAPKPSFSFGATPSAPASPSFGGFGASTTNAPSNSQPAAQSTPFKSFGSTAPASPAPATATVAAPSFKFGESTAQKADAPAASAASAFNFGTSSSSTAQKSDAPAKAPTPAFNFGGAAQAPPSLAPSPAKLGETPSSGFNFGGSTSKPAEQVSYPKLNGGTSQADSSSSSSSSFAFTPSAPSQTESAPASAFKFTPSSAAAAPAPTSPFEPSAPSSTATESSKPQSNGLGSSMFNSVPAQQKPAESAFKGFGTSTTASQPSAPSSGFKFGATSAQPPASSSALVPSAEMNEANPLSRLTSAPTIATPPATPDMAKASDIGALKIRQLNDAFRVHIASADSSHDWSNLMRFYVEQVSSLAHQSHADPSAAAPKAITSASHSASVIGQKRKSDDEGAKQADDKRSKTAAAPSTTPQKPLSSTASLFDDILKSGEKPNTPAQQTNVFSAQEKAPATAPPAKSNPFASIARNTSATPGPGPKSAAPTASPFKVNPPVSQGANMANPFKPSAGSAAPSAAPTFQIPKFGAGSTGGSTPNFMSAFGKKAAAEEEKKREERKADDMDSDDDEEEWERKDAEEQARKRAELLAASQALKFTVDATKKSDTPASIFSVAKTSSTPAASASVFGQKSAAPAASANMFGHLSGKSTEDEQESDAENDDDEDVHDALKNKSTAGKSLFERVGPSGDSDKDKSSAPGTPFKFGSFGSNTSPAGDNTWKENTPIKFGGASAAGTTTPDGSPAKAAAPSIFSSQSSATPKFSFGAASQATPGSDKPSSFTGLFGAKKDEAAKPATPSSTASIFAESTSKSPSVGFQFGGPGSNSLAPPTGTSSVFGSQTTSRATTPGTATTDAEGSAAESEPSDEQKDAQKELHALTPEEIAANDLIYEGRCRALKFVKDSTPPWVPQGTGPLRLLRNKETGKPRVLMRTDPGGKVVLNFNVMLNKDMYTHKQGKMVQISIPTADKKMETYMWQFGDENKAKAAVGAVHDAIDKVET